MIIRRATREDLGAIRAIQSASPEASAWDPESYLGYDCDVAIEGGRVVGFLAHRTLVESEHEILNLGVDPAERRRGVATALVRNVLNGRAGTWYLEVRESNAPAIGLYKSLGFRVTGHRENYYDNPAEAAIVMRFFS